MARKPPIFMKPGDDVAITIEGIGELRNPVVAAPDPFRPKLPRGPARRHSQHPTSESESLHGSTVFLLHALLGARITAVLVSRVEYGRRRGAFSFVWTKCSVSYPPGREVTTQHGGRDTQALEQRGPDRLLAPRIH